MISFKILPAPFSSTLFKSLVVYNVTLGSSHLHPLFGHTTQRQISDLQSQGANLNPRNTTHMMSHSIIGSMHYLKQMTKGDNSIPLFTGGETIMKWWIYNVSQLYVYERRYCWLSLGRWRERVRGNVAYGSDFTWKRTTHRLKI